MAMTHKIVRRNSEDDDSRQRALTDYAKARKHRRAEFSDQADSVLSRFLGAVYDPTREGR